MNRFSWLFRLNAGARWAALFCVVLTVPAQEPQVFRAGTRLVQVDVIVRDKNGPVAGLTKDDFTVTDDGKPRSISVFSSTVSLGSGRVASADAVPLPPGAVSNRVNRAGETVRSATIVLLDRLNTDKLVQPYANGKVVQFLQKNGNQDPIGIYVMGTGVRAIQEVTDDPARLQRAARSLKTQDARRITADVTAEPTGMADTDEGVAKALEALQDFEVKDRVALTRESLIAIAHHLAKVPGRKNLVWISASFPLIIQRAHETIEFTKEVDEAARALADANVAVYMVDARGLAPSGMGNAELGPVAGCKGNCAPRLTLATGGPSGVDTMNRIAGLTGGQAFYNTNGIEESIRKAVDDAQLTYTIGFYASEDTFDDRYHKLVVKVAKNNLDVRFRPGYFATKIPAGSQTAAPKFKDLLQGQLNEVAIGMTVQADADPEQASAFRVRALIDLHDIHLELQDQQWQGSVSVSLFLAGAKTARTITHKIAIPENDLAAALTRPVEIVSTISDDGKATELRAAAQDPATGAAGSVRVPLHREPTVKAK